MHGWPGSAFQTKLKNLVDSVARAANVEDAVILVRDELALDHVTYYMPSPNVLPATTPFVRSTYPPEWIARYLLRGYVTIDPVVREGFRATRPFAWHELGWDGPAEQSLMADALAHGLGDKGFSIPMIDRVSRRSLLTLNASLPAQAWADFIDQTRSALTGMARAIHDKAVAEINVAAPPAPSLSPREAECLLWTARGKDAKAIAAIFDLSEYTVRSYLRTARQKLKCRTLSQAVAKAMQYGMIHPVGEEEDGV